MNGREDTLSGKACGKNPGTLSREELEALGHKPMSPGKSLRLRCLDCCAGAMSEVKLCPAVACPSWPFRMGKNPWRSKKVVTDAQKAALRSRLDTSDGK
ncbi:hypothetical protein UFOVP1623_6 [uncultured Caudovirales phage]|uniref:Uncharacterized protein n=1 Tax=uncultured Caudovirales phage TaxID=2100421 RepID=A0A6J5SZB8_9CAUD|nr:hypothetical protein UFOVP1376_3 [uncultured Caudovirales phage]CAB4220620.1 hypothetical protein UFOVP1623_6 [uncultured Caudovirales phage]